MSATEHYHVHSHIGGGYLCDCDYHSPLETVKDRNAAMFEERAFWEDFKYQGEQPERIRISGNVKSGYVITDLDSIAWERYVDWYSCDERACWEDPWS